MQRYLILFILFIGDNMTYEFFKKRKLLSSMFIISIISFLFGVLFISILNNSSQELIKISVNTYFNSLYEGNINYLSLFYSYITNNLVLVIFVWIIGISIIGILFIIFILLFKCFLTGFSLVSIIFTYGTRGIFVGIIYMIPEIIMLFVLFVLCYYSISFSGMLFNYLFRNVDISRKIAVSRYLKVFIIVFCLVIFLSLIEAFVIPNILKMF